MSYGYLIPRIENWARFYRDHPRQGKAGSAEGNYRIPQPDYSTIIELFPELKDALEAPKTRTAPPDARDAMEVQAGVASLPEARHRLILSMWHIRMLPAPRIERMLHLGRRGFEPCYYGALRMLDHALEKQVNKSTLIHNNVIAYSSMSSYKIENLA